MSATFVVTLEVDGNRAFLNFGTVSGDASVAECLAAMIEAPTVKELLAAHPERSFKIRVQVRR